MLRFNKHLISSVHRLLWAHSVSLTFLESRGGSWISFGDTPVPGPLVSKYFDDSQDLSHGRGIYVKQIHLDINSLCTFLLFILLSVKELIEL